jgi:hypothetical protein
MGKLTEKEITIEGTLCTLDLYAEYDELYLTGIYLRIDIDGQILSGNNGLGVRIHDGLKFTSFYGAILETLNAGLVEKLEIEVRKLVKLNEN